MTKRLIIFLLILLIAFGAVFVIRPSHETRATLTLHSYFLWRDSSSQLVLFDYYSQPIDGWSRIGELRVVAKLEKSTPWGSRSTRRLNAELHFIADDPSFYSTLPGDNVLDWIANRSLPVKDETGNRFLDTLRNTFGP